MERNSLVQLVRRGLATMKAGSQIAAHAVTEVQRDVRHPRLKVSLENENNRLRQWETRINRSLQEAGGTNEEQQDRVMEAQYEVSRHMRQQAPDDLTRDMSIIASSQMCLHHAIAACGTLKTYAAYAGLHQTAQDMQNCLEEAKREDEELTHIATEVLKSHAQRAA